MASVILLQAILLVAVVMSLSIFGDHRGVVCGQMTTHNEHHEMSGEEAGLRERYNGKIKYMSTESVRRSSYSSVRMLREWAKRMEALYPEVVRVTTAYDKYGVDVAGSNSCDGVPCHIYILEIGPVDLTMSAGETKMATSKSRNDGASTSDKADEKPPLQTNAALQKTRETVLRETEGIVEVVENGEGEGAALPSVFVSGAHHGDETVGPIVSTELVEYMLRGYRAGDAWLSRLVRTRKTVVVPAANAKGWDSHQREELNLDPNRDYPHDQPKECLLTQTGKALNAIFKDHSFKTCLTFHGGIDLIAYPWGDLEHESKSTSPDDVLFDTIANIMSKHVAGSAGQGRKYNYGTLATNPYSVAGGFEDWAYGASWSGQTKASCQVGKGNGNTNINVEDAIKYSDTSNRCLVYLVETSMAKNPTQYTLGDREDMLSMGTRHDGHVPRNLRLSLMLVDMAKPYVQLVSLKKSGERELTISYAVGGCLEVDKTYVELRRDGKTIASSAKSSGSCIWSTQGKLHHSLEEPFMVPDFTVSVKLPPEESMDTPLEVVVSARVDSKFAERVDDANPNMEPQLNVVRDNVDKIYVTTLSLTNAEKDVQRYEKMFTHVNLDDFPGHMPVPKEVEAWRQRSKPASKSGLVSMSISSDISMSSSRVLFGMAVIFSVIIAVLALRNKQHPRRRAPLLKR